MPAYIQPKQDVSHVDVRDTGRGVRECGLPVVSANAPHRGDTRNVTAGVMAPNTPIKLADTPRLL